ncbi:MAG: hypothetical protein ABI430_03085 [Candidatus Taylorbacteria bacterium]
MKKYIFRQIAFIVLVGTVFFLISVSFHKKVDVEFVDPEKTIIVVGLDTLLGLLIYSITLGYRGRPHSWHELGKECVYRVCFRSTSVRGLPLQTVLLVVSEGYDRKYPRYVEFEIELPEAIRAGESFAIFDSPLDGLLFAIGHPGVHLLCSDELVKQKQPKLRLASA